MPDATNTVLIVGASGVIGAAAAEHFASLPGWRVLGVSRRAPDPSPPNYRHMALDLTDAAACRAAADGFGNVTHVVYAALFEKPGLIPGWYEQDQMQTNLAMMRNLMDPLLAAAKSVRHVSVLQGTKAYGAHVHPLAVPAREDAPRDAHENFYWLHPRRGGGRSLELHHLASAGGVRRRDRRGDEPDPDPRRLWCDLPRTQPAVLLSRRARPRHRSG